MPVPVRVFNSTKTDSADFRLIHTENNQTFAVNPGFKAAELKIDPEYWLVSKTEQVVHVPVASTTEDVIVYPNPFSDVINISVPNNETITSLKLYKIKGELVKEIEESLFHLNLSHLPNGEYLLKIKTRKRELAKKIIKL